jgi:LCP family protein required for cell wall assembly
MFGRVGGMTLAAKVGYGVACGLAALTLVASGIASYGEQVLGGIGGGIGLGGPQTGAMNILVMGLESRTDYQGNILPAGLLAAMHAGSVQGVENGVGGQDTNTLILIHIFAGGQKAVGFSIPRNDYVNFPHSYDGQSQGMIDQAYGLAYAQSLNASSPSDKDRYTKANQAGQTATVDTVEAVTGQPVDHFFEMNLAGFYELAQLMPGNGIYVCLKSWNGGENLHDANSGFDQPGPGYHFLHADQALAFVRERDNLPNGDIDRTRRQQAVIDYVIWKLDHNGVLSDLPVLTSLMSAAKQYIITDSGWNLLDFATEMRALTGSHLQFETLPIKGYATIYPGGEAEDINTVDVSAIQSEVKKAFTDSSSSGSSAKPASKPKPKAAAPSYPASATVVDVYNANGIAGMAGDVMTALVGEGYTQGQTGDSPTQQAATQVLYGAGASAKANAAKIAAQFGVTAQASAAVSAGTVEVVIGTSMPTLPSSLAGGSGGSGGSSPSAQPSAQASLPGNATSVQQASSNDDTNTPLHVASTARYGIPCVY